MATAKQRKRKQQRRTEHNSTRSSPLVKLANKGEFKHSDHVVDKSTKAYFPTSQPENIALTKEALEQRAQLLGHVYNTEGDANGRDS